METENSIYYIIYPENKIKEMVANYFWESNKL